MLPLRIAVSLAGLSLAAGTPVFAQALIDVKTARIPIDAEGRVGPIHFADGSAWPKTVSSAFAVINENGSFGASSIRRTGDVLDVGFCGGGTARFHLKEGNGFAIIELLSVDTATPIHELRLFHVCAPEDATLISPLNAAHSGDNQVALSALVPNVQAVDGDTGVTRGNRPGCEHRLEPVDTAKSGSLAAKLTATCDGAPGGWVVRGIRFSKPMDLSGCTAVRAWVHGDGGGQSLKIQLYDGKGGYRDDYIPIDFQGWKQVTLVKPALNTLRYEQVEGINFYYNGMPPSKTVSCLIDRVEAVVPRDGDERSVLLEDFEDANSPLFGSPGRVLETRTAQRHGIAPAKFGLIAVPREDFFDASIRCDEAAGLRVPRLDGVAAKRSDRVKRSYFFLTGFQESQFDEALAIARRGGFDTILILQDSWCESTGHFHVNRKNFPDGLDGLKRTVKRFKEAGFHVGFHFLAASIYPPDKYLTPVPDSRLVTKANVALAEEIDAAATFIPTVEAPAGFPTEDGGYMGEGTVLRINDELIQYERPSMEKPYGFFGCRRGHLGTHATAHEKGEKVAHLLRSYGYHLYDMDTSLLAEVATNFAKIADACDIDMIYFDGAERLQGDHWYYNGLMIQAFYGKLKRSDILLQASSNSHFSWRFLARNASADGHGDLKGYLDERSPVFDYFARSGMPLDIGWYYGYDTNTSLDMYEYILGATLGYDSSMSFQVSPGAAANHPFTGAVLDRIARYERLRLSGRVSGEMKERLRVHPALRGKGDGERPGLVRHRREYRLIGEEGSQAFQRVVYEPWDWKRAGTADGEAIEWEFTIEEEPTRVGMEIHVLDGAKELPRPEDRVLRDPVIRVGEQEIHCPGDIAAGQYLLVHPGEPARLYGPDWREPTEKEATTISLEKGTYRAVFRAANGAATPVRVRLILELPEE